MKLMAHYLIVIHVDIVTYTYYIINNRLCRHNYIYKHILKEETKHEYR